MPERQTDIQLAQTVQVGGLVDADWCAAKLDLAQWCCRRFQGMKANLAAALA